MNNSLKEVSERLELVRFEIKSLNEELLNKQSELVGLVKQHKDLKEEQRIANNRKVIKEITQREIDIESFQNNYPKLCALAKKRDLGKDLESDYSNTESLSFVKK